MNGQRIFSLVLVTSNQTLAPLVFDQSGFKNLEGKLTKEDKKLNISVSILKKKSWINFIL